MKNSGLETKLKSLSSLPALKRSNKDMSFIDTYSDDKIHDSRLLYVFGSC